VAFFGTPSLLLVGSLPFKEPIPWRVDKQKSGSVAEAGCTLELVEAAYARWVEMGCPVRGYLTGMVWMV
jgi:hypothetical protein